MGVDRYTIVDLPRINVLQGFYLLKALGSGSVNLYAETNFDAPIHVIPDFSIGNLGRDACDLALNQDSLPEINPIAAERYINWIKEASRSWFYSVNQETKASYSDKARQLSVAELVKQSGGYRRVSRTPYWLRKGYVAEIYDVRS